MNNSVKVTADSKGQVVVPSENNEEYGYVRVEQERTLVDEVTGWLRKKVLSALIPGSVKDLNSMGWKDGQSIGGKVVVTEQLTPFNTVNPDKHLKIAGDTDVVCKSGDQPIYRNTRFTTNPNALDVLVPHTNTEEIRAKQAAGETSDFRL